jgi:hypothetical protein
VTGTPDPNQEFLNAINQSPKTVSPEEVNQAEQALFTSMREQSGARTAFGDQADAVFLKLDQDAAAALDEMVNRASEAVVPPIKVSPQISNTGSLGTTRPIPPDTRNYWTKSMVQSLIELMGVPNVANLQRTDTGNVDGPITEKGDPNGTGDYYFFQPKFIGSRMEASGTLRMANVTQFSGNGIYNESVGYTFSMELCPDAQGNVPLQFTFKATVGQPGAGEQVAVLSQATGHVNDDGKLGSYDDTSTFQGARQRTPPPGMDPRFANIFFEFQEKLTQYTGNNIPPTYKGNYTRGSVALDYDFAAETASSLRLIEMFLIQNAFQIAEEKWSTGYCVEIQVPELGAGVKSVQPNSETSFTANVHQRFENAALQVPVIATLNDGQVFVSPSGSKVPAPASFTYKAPGENNKTAIVILLTRSNRGIATLDVKFKTGGQGWKVETWNDVSMPGFKLTGGLSCISPYGPWEFKTEGTTSQGGTTSQTFTIPYSVDGNTIATQAERLTLPIAGMVGDYKGNPKVTFVQTPEGYRMDFAPFRMTGSTCVTNGKCQAYDQVKNAWSTNIVPADPGQCP